MRLYRPVVYHIKPVQNSSTGEYQYLGLLLDSQLSSKKHVKKVLNIAKFNLADFRFIRNSGNTLQ